MFRFPSNFTGQNSNICPAAAAWRQVETSSCAESPGSEQSSVASPGEGGGENKTCGRTVSIISNI